MSMLLPIRACGLGLCINLETLHGAPQHGPVKPINSILLFNPVSLKKKLKRPHI